MLKVGIFVVQDGRLLVVVAFDGDCWWGCDRDGEEFEIVEENCEAIDV